MSRRLDNRDKYDFNKVSKPDGFYYFLLLFTARFIGPIKMIGFWGDHSPK